MDASNDNALLEAENKAETFFVHADNQKFVAGDLAMPIVVQGGFLLSIVWCFLFFLLVIAITWLSDYYIVSPLITGVLAFVLALMTVFIHRHLTYRRFLKEGQLLEGRVVASGFLRMSGVHLLFDIPLIFSGLPPLAASEYPQGAGDYHPWVRYIFRSPAGRVISGGERIVSKDVRQLPERGTAVKVLYLSDRKYHLL